MDDEILVFRVNGVNYACSFDNIEDIINLPPEVKLPVSGCAETIINHKSDIYTTFSLNKCFFPEKYNDIPDPAAHAMIAEFKINNTLKKFAFKIEHPGKIYYSSDFHEQGVADEVQFNRNYIKKVLYGQDNNPIIFLNLMILVRDMYYE